MKKYLIVIAAALLAFSATASAQMNFGVTAGMNFNSAKIGDVKMDARAGWNVGATVQFDLPLGFSLQPSLVYTQKGAFIGDKDLAGITQKVGALNLPVSVQWGPDLLVFRPFLDVTPYVGYALNTNIKSVADEVDLGGLNEIKDEALAEVKKGFGDMVNKLEYGLGIGAGVEVWRFQVICRYNWNFGPLVNVTKDTEVPEIVQTQIKDAVKGKNFGGVTLSLAFMFGK